MFAKLFTKTENISVPSRLKRNILRFDINNLTVTQSHYI